ncbi:serine hydroxymethyltransferase [Candidatus Saccharibacteria bacterium CG11_big_fil_rev_8_21_14_0_20_41_19]|nr:serine hydroxymethyltransferase [Candidatus Saccharibacteria bacterium]OIP86074.1 MAG: serine hydroxymethyltransferase [Candidatus Saccharibacteria bacterium CG2_30_41_52]PIQ70793.1 MAG: serine hydroxymethyltransferase [Candidatus Saccharibacteria bacterium CG11_big_fil_rev_8_21_14_0_20_41_19]PIZ59701.1 MAG: serine hydroxymethyltransferase [Candidatus Saccharibacteria bacterium CG_4_10_14_0_2_um_filter_41_11]PJC29607.1 MAG: serine hydroxymethyltransferase [Candidatus Saccharibacteria bacteri
MKDKLIADYIAGEEVRQREGLELIPSENYVSRDVLTALGSVLTNKYAEGYPGKRYYGGQEYTDKVEQLAIDRAKQLFGADHANVQPHSGAPANEAVYSAWLEPGDTVIAMDLGHGGHLTHGAPVTRSAKLYNFVRYKMKDTTTGEIDYEELRELAIKHKPKIILAGFSAYPRELDYAKFAAIGNEVGALLMADMAHIAGLIVAGVAKNPFDYGFHVITTTTHKTLRGPRGGMILTKGIVSTPLKAPEKTIANIPTLIDRAIFPGMQGGPHMHSIAAKAVAFYEALQPDFKVYAQQIVDNASVLADELKKHGFYLVTGGTSNHMMLADVYKSFGIDGKTAEVALDSIGLTLNANAIPDDTLPPFRPSGIRLGTPAVTTRGLKQEHMVQIASWMKQAIDNREKPAELAKLRKQVVKLAKSFPLPSDK